jgi:hypothetical protein
MKFLITEKQLMLIEDIELKSRAKEQGDESVEYYTNNPEYFHYGIYVKLNDLNRNKILNNLIELGKGMDYEIFNNISDDLKIKYLKSRINKNKIFKGNEYLLKGYEFEYISDELKLIYIRNIIETKQLWKLKIKIPINIFKQLNDKEKEEIITSYSSPVLLNYGSFFTLSDDLKKIYINYGWGIGEEYFKKSSDVVKLYWLNKKIENGWKLEKYEEKWLKNYKEKNNLTENYKNWLLSGLIGASSFIPQDVKTQTKTPTQIQQTQTKVLSKVIGPIGKQPIDNPDLDLVHGILGSKRLNDDFEKRVSDELKRLNDLGHKTDINNIQIKTYVKDNFIITESSCDIIESKNDISYNIFTTRGSIGKDFESRHDNQINGLEDRLNKFYGGQSKKIKTVTINFIINNTNVSYKQSFFVSSQLTQEQGIVEIKGNNLNDLRTKLLTTKNIKIDLNSLDIDINNLKVTYKKGNTDINNLSLIFDDSDNIDYRMNIIQQKNPTLRIVKNGKIGDFDWVFSVILKDNLTENRINIKSRAPQQEKEREEYINTFLNKPIEDVYKTLPSLNLFTDEQIDRLMNNLSVYLEKHDIKLKKLQDNNEWVLKYSVSNRLITIKIEKEEFHPIKSTAKYKINNNFYYTHSDLDWTTFHSFFSYLNRILPII